MATRGKKPNLQVATTNGQTVLRSDIAADLAEHDGITPDVKLTKAERQIWDERIGPLHWLTRADRNTATRFCQLEALYRKEKGHINWPTPKLRELRALENELGMNPTSRIRIATDRKKTDDPAEKYF